MSPKEAIKLMLKQSGISQSELARRTGKSPSSVNQAIKANKNTSMLISEFSDYADACGYKVVIQLTKKQHEPVEFVFE